MRVSEMEGLVRLVVLWTTSCQANCTTYLWNAYLANLIITVVYWVWMENQQNLESAMKVSICRHICGWGCDRDNGDYGAKWKKLTQHCHRSWSHDIGNTSILWHTGKNSLDWCVHEKEVSFHCVIHGVSGESVTGNRKAHKLLHLVSSLHKRRLVFTSHVRPPLN